jgi:hypothetical protein
MPKARIKKQPIHLDDFGDTMESESDRDCVLVACHVLDVALEHRLRFHLSRRRQVIKRAIDPLFETTRPLSSFWAKIHTAYALALLDDWAFNDLNTLRSIRNALAHSHGTFTFDEREIESLLFRLHAPRRAFGFPGREWSLSRAREKCETLATEWRRSPRYAYFQAGFHFLHGYVTKGIAYKTRATS